MTNSGVTQPICRVDHHGVFCQIKAIPNRGGTFTRTIYNYNLADYIHLREALSYAPWNTGLNLFEDINDCVYYCYDLFMEAAKMFIPNKVITVKPRDKEWMTARIHFLINKRDCFYRRYKKRKSPDLLEQYRQSCSDVKQEINDAKYNYYNRLVVRLQNPDTLAKEYHKLCKRFFKGKSQATIPAMTDNGEIFSDPFRKQTFSMIISPRFLLWTNLRQGSHFLRYLLKRTQSWPM